MKIYRGLVNLNSSFKGTEVKGNKQFLLLDAMDFQAAVRNGIIDKMEPSVEVPDEFEKQEELLKSIKVLIFSDKHPISDMKSIQLIISAQSLGIKVLPFSEVSVKNANMISIQALNGLSELTNHIQQKPLMDRIYFQSKDGIDRLAAFLLIIALLPILAIASVIALIIQGRPLLYGQERSGLNGKTFRLFKFRTMLNDAEKNGPAWSSADSSDERLTRIGRFFRRTHIDELPQLFNVLAGDLSLVGPRPERPYFVEKLTDLYPEFQLRTLVKPGITGWAQVMMGYANTNEDSKRKAAFDIYYMMNRSLALDFEIMLRTIGVVFGGGTEGMKEQDQVSIAAPSLVLVNSGEERTNGLKANQSYPTGLRKVFRKQGELKLVTPINAKVAD